LEPTQNLRVLRGETFGGKRLVGLGRRLRPDVAKKRVERRESRAAPRTDVEVRMHAIARASAVGFERSLGPQLGQDGIVEVAVPPQAVKDGHGVSPESCRPAHRLRAAFSACGSRGTGALEPSTRSTQSMR